MKRLVFLGVIMVAGLSLFAGCGVATYTEAETQISTGVNQEFIIAVQHTNPRVGNHWEESHNDKMLALVDIEYTPDEESRPDLGGTQSYRFRALEAGKTEATFTQKTATDRVIKQVVFSVDIK